MAEPQSIEQLRELVNDYIKGQLRCHASSAAIRQVLVSKGLDERTAHSMVSRLAQQAPQGVRVSNGTNFRNIGFDIVGHCNAKCPWCVTGREGGTVKRFADLDLFVRTLDRLLELGAILPRQIIHLFSWGEPLLHPRFYDFLKAMAERELWAGISTNGSSPPKKVDIDLLSNIGYIKFSMPGFSQRSYDRIHGFKFEKILNNIDAWFEALRPTGHPEVKVIVACFAYQFNMHEYPEAKKYFQEKYGITPSHSMAWLNGWDMSWDYLHNKMDPAVLKDAAKDLFFYYVDDLIASMPADYRCPEFDTLFLDEDCNIIMCCGLPRQHEDYRIGSPLDLTLAEIKEKKLQGKICGECIRSGMTYWGHNPQRPPRLAV